MGEVKKTFQCNHCGKLFAYKGFLEKHTVREHEGKELAYTRLDNVDPSEFQEQPDDRFDRLAVVYAEELDKMIGLETWEVAQRPLRGAKFLFELIVKAIDSGADLGRV